MSQRTAAIIQARMGSSRLPGKVMAEVMGQPLLRHVVDRVRRIAGVEVVVLATTRLEMDQPLLVLARQWGIAAYAGAVDDVLDRYYQAARWVRADTVIRVTADCPLLDPLVARVVLARFRAGDVAYVSNAHPPTYPDGLDVEAFSLEVLARAWREAREVSEREHVTPFLWKHPDRFPQANVTCERDLSGLRWTVDEPRDLAFVRAVYARLHVLGGALFGMEAVLGLLAREPELLAINADIPRDAGYLKSLAADARAS